MWIKNVLNNCTLYVSGILENISEHFTLVGCKLIKELIKQIICKTLCNPFPKLHSVVSLIVFVTIDSRGFDYSYGLLGGMANWFNYTTGWVSFSKLSQSLSN